MKIVKILKHNSWIIPSILGVVVVILGIFLLIIFYSNGYSLKEISNFEECASAGFVVGESYPRQCWNSDGGHFVEDISNDLNDYFADEIFRRGVDNVGWMPIEGFNPEIYKMAFSGFIDSDFDNAKAIGGVWEFDGELKWIGDNFGGPITSADGTITREGLVVVLDNLEKRLGIEVNGRGDVNKIIDSIDEKKQNFCSIDSRNTDACITLYDPVCGWNNPEEIKCIKFPCATTYSNSCNACTNSEVLYWTSGVCPE